MTTTDLLPENDAQGIRDGVAHACLHGTDQDQLDTPDGSLRLVAASRVAADHAGRLLSDAVAGARHAGHSWAAIGSVLEISRQAAQQRFSPTTDPSEATTPEQRVIRRVNAFNEMAILGREQADGWHLVGFGAGKLVVEASDHRWEHQRLTFAGHPLLRSMERDQWQIVGVWGPWTYLKRPVGAAAS